VRSHVRTGGLFVLAGGLFGGTFVAVNAGLQYLPPLLFLAFRFDIAAVLLLVYVFLRVDPWRPQGWDDVAGVIAGTVAIGVPNALLFIGQQYLTSAVAAILFSLAPVLTPGFAGLLLSDEHLSSRGFAGILIALLGVGLVVRPNPSQLFSGTLIGRVLLLGAAAGVALGSVLIRRANTSMSSITLVAWSLPLSALLLHVTSFLAGESFAAVEWTPVALAALGYVSVFAAAIAYPAYFELLDTIGAIRANLVNYLTPIVAALGGWLLLGETLTPLTLLGFAVIFGGFAVLEYPTLVDALPRAVAFNE
jgi:drug/metabolite transporter (DMT)-like permease